MRYETKSKIAYTIAACILIIIIIAAGFFLYYLRTQVVIPVNSVTTEPTKNSTTVETQAVFNSESIDDYFIEVGCQGNHYFLYDKYTKVMYTQCFSPKGGSTSLTVMVNSEGKPLTYDEWRSFQEK